METALFLGAGASRSFGYPLTRDILPLILKRLNAGTLFKADGAPDDRHGIDRLRFQYQFEKLVPGWKEAWKAANPEPVAGTPNPIGVDITAVLTLVDYTLATAADKGGEGPSGLASFRELLERAIYEVLTPRPEGVTTAEHAARQAFGEWLLDHAEKGGISVITTNYDLNVDTTWFRALRRKNGDATRGLDLGFEYRDVGDGALVPRPARPAGRLLKLHGSLNWLRCPLCGHTYVNSFGDIASLAFEDQLTDDNTCHCNPWVRLRLPLVAPSLARTVNDRNVLSVWESAREALQEARTWYIIGYSLPPEDIAIRALLCRAWGASDTPRRVNVVQSGRNEEAVYRTLFPGCEYHANGLAEFLSRRSH